MISVLVLALILILARVTAFVAFVPLFGGQPLPRLVKAGLAIALTLMWSADLLTNPAVTRQVTVEAQVSWLYLALATGREALLGVLLGYTFGLLLLPARIAGEFLTQELGLSFGSYFDPGSGTAASPVTQVFDLLGTLLFLVLDVHHLLLAVFYSTFAVLPLGGDLPQGALLHAVTGAGVVQEWGLMLVAPTAFCLFLTTVVLALLGRAVPQMNLHSVGFSLRLVVGLIALLVMLPGIIASLVALLGQGSRLVMNTV